MSQRLEDGLTIIESVSGDLDVASHSYMIAVPGCDYSAYSASQVETLIKTHGWSWSDTYGWVFTSIG